MSVINTNITALISQQNLGRSQSALQTSMERLSSGLRINSAKDDAAGLAIANRMSAQITGLAQAQRNANDGISLAQTAEGSLGQITDNIQRIRELTVQAQNGTNSSDDLQSIQDEITQRLDEVNRISRETSFNGVKVLAEDTALQIQVGANDGEVISVGLKKINGSSLNLTNFTVNKPDLSEAITVGADGLTPINIATGNTLHEVLDADGVGTGDYVIQDSNGNLFAAADNADSTTDFDYAGGNVDAVIKTVDDLDANTYNIRYANDGTEVVELTKTNGETFFATAADAATLDSTAPVIPDDLNAFTGEVFSGTPLTDLDEALNTVDSMRSELGAIQNRFEDAINNLKTNEINLAAARSRIEDADYAVEVSNMTRSQILQQAGTSVLAQANQVPQGVLSLLG